MDGPERPHDRARRGGDQRLVDAVAQLSFVVQLVLTDVASAHGVSLAQLRLLAVVQDRTVAMADLARHLGLDRSSVTGLVDRAAKRAFVQREPRPEDGRGVRVRITPDGDRLADQIKDAVTTRVRVLTDVLSVEERSTMTALIRRVLDAVSSLPPR